eukprot:4751331-Amphidinium_carterae.1
MAEDLDELEVDSIVDDTESIEEDIPADESDGQEDSPGNESSTGKGDTPADESMASDNLQEDSHGDESSVGLHDNTSVDESPGQTSVEEEQNPAAGDLRGGVRKALEKESVLGLRGKLRSSVYKVRDGDGEAQPLLPHGPGARSTAVPSAAADVDHRSAGPQPRPYVVGSKATSGASSSGGGGSKQVLFLPPLRKSTDDASPPKLLRPSDGVVRLQSELSGRAHASPDVAEAPASEEVDNEASEKDNSLDAIEVEAQSAAGSTKSEDHGAENTEPPPEK